MVQLPSRPEPPVSAAERALRWAQWIGPARLLSGAMSVVALVAVGTWLLRPAQASTESLLPVAQSVPTVNAATASPSVPPVSDQVVVVHVAGAVVQAGVRTLPVGARVVDAVAAAGGAAPDAHLDGLNLAATLRDGQQVYVPRIGEPVQIGVEAGSGGPIDLNAASASDLEVLPGIGPSLAAAIIAHRDQHGPFTSVDELADVPGIGATKLASIRALVVV